MKLNLIKEIDGEEMRAIKYKYALALNLSITENGKSMINRAIEQAIDIVKELEIGVRLQNPFNNKEILIDPYNLSEIDFEELVEHLIQ